MTTNNQSRNTYFDFLRGIAIVMVVLIHTSAHAQFFCTVTWDFLRNILNPAVPIFFAISGFFLVKKDVSSFTKYFNFLKVHALRIYVPTLIFSIPWLALVIKKSGLKLWQLRAFFTCDFSVYYFIFVIIQLYALLPMFTKIYRGGVTICALISVGSLLIWVYAMHSLTCDTGLVFRAGWAPLWVAFFALGAYLRKINRNYKINYWIIGAIVFFVLSVFETIFLDISGINAGGAGTRKLSSYAYSFCLIVVLFSTAAEQFFGKFANVYNCKTGTKILSHKIAKIIYNMFVQLGIYSFGIYLVHCYFITFAIMPKFSWALSAIFTLTYSAMFIWASKKIFKERLKKFIGF